MQGMEKHQASVDLISTRIRGFFDRKEAFRIYHGSTNSTRKSSYRKSNIVDTSGLTSVLKIDSKKRTALVEPNVAMDQLVRATVKRGLVPPVVMEFPGITVGGGFAGTSGESSSFKYGLFDCTISQLEIVLADGQVVNASEEERPDLFYGAAGSCGTLGVITLLEIQLIEAKTYVELVYRPLPNVSVAIEEIKTAINDPSIDYIDGIVFSQKCCVVMTGRLKNTCLSGAKIQRFTRPSDQWFYRHVEKHYTNVADGPFIEAIPLEDYLFRYDRGAFWGGLYAFKFFKVPFNRITRWALDYFMHTRVMYHALHESGLAEQTIVQDLGIPVSNVQQFTKYLEVSLDFYPLWLCPVQPSQHMLKHPQRSFNMGKDVPLNEQLLNVGVWGMGPKNRNKFIEVNRGIEHKVRQLSGLKTLYAHVYYTEEEFWQIYDLQYYESLRRKYNATSLPSVFDKVKANVNDKYEGANGLLAKFLIWFWSLWPLNGLYGVYCALVGGDYLLKKD